MTTDPDGPLRQRAYASPLRDERLAAWLGASLGVLFGVCFVTGLFSHLHQNPVSWLPVPARPAGLYRLTQGIHVAAGIASLPVLLAKLWLVWPRLLSVPPFRRLSDAVERLGVVVLVGGGIFMVASGVANIALWYPWGFSFRASHYWVGWATMGAIVAHIGAKWRVSGRSLRNRRARPALAAADPVLGTDAEGTNDGLTRRGFLLTVGAASGALTALTVGQTVPVLSPIALLAPRDPRDRPINRTADMAGVVGVATSAAYRLRVEGRVEQPLELTLDDLAGLAIHEARLPIACVEGWSYSAPWRGVRLGDLLTVAGAADDASVEVVSLEPEGAFRTSLVNHRHARDPDTLLATHLDGEILSLDHGYPLRLIGPDRPGVNQTKWVTRLVVR
ncbi:MAG: molybdopterin-dependent oxidoreductase [Actinomycetota bacterium]|nr:molybdopterin-dependent oxidoreductase [Actinomycetota bacterium]